MVDGDYCDFQLSLTTNASDLPPKVSEICQKKFKSVTSDNDAGMFVEGVKGPIMNLLVEVYLLLS